MASDLYAAGYKRIIQAWQVAAERIAAAYERNVPVRDGVYRNSDGPINDSIFDLESILSSIGDELSRLVLSITPALREWAVRTEQWHRGKFKGAILTATGIDAGMFLGPEDTSETVAAFVARNVGLVRSVSDDTRAKVSDIVLRNYQQRAPARDVAKEINEAVGLGRQRALRIASDQNKKLSARLDQARQEEAGITKFKWRHSHKLHPRAIHVAHDGKVYAWSDPPQLDGKDDTPGLLPFCGCRAQAVIDLD